MMERVQPGPAAGRGAVRWWWGGLLLLAAACVHAPQPVVLNPMPKISGQAVGKLLPVAVRVADARPAPGTADVPSVRDAREQYPITTDVVGVVRAQVMSGLDLQGFRPAPATGADAGRSLTVEVRVLELSVLPGFGSSDINAAAALTAIARRADATYEVTHQVNEHRKVFFGPTRKDVAATVNGALGEALRRILEDEKLLAFLAGGT
jgi:uncharacterized lipoprotein YajG